MLHKKNKTITARGLIMSLFNAPETSTLSISRLISAGQLFGIEAPAMRMAATRLIKDQLIHGVDRGVYATGKKAISLNSEIQSWRTANKKTKNWDGDWLIALTHHLGRTNKTQLRSMERAFKIYGFIEVELGFWLRPANLIIDLESLKQRLVDIGLDSRIYLMKVNQTTDMTSDRWRSKWPVKELEASYQAMITQLESSQASLEQLSPRDAAKESLIIGEAAIRLINLDPLLPKEIINSDLFDKVVRTMIAYDQTGQQCWQKFLADQI